MVFPLTAENASTWRWINFISFLATAVCNGLSAAGAFGESQGTVSDNNRVFITPASWAFTIWSVIYTFQAIILVWGPLCRQQDPAVESKIFGPEGLGYWYLISSIVNCIWVIVFSLDTVATMWITLVLIACLLASLLKMWKNIDNLLREDTAVVEKNEAEQGEMPTFDFVSKYFLWIGFSLYTGWVTTATALNLTLAFNKSGYLGESDTWSIVVCVLLSIVYLLTGAKYLDPIYTLVGCWAFAAISDESGSVSKTTEDATMITSFVIGIPALLFLIFGSCKGGFAYFFPAPNVTTTAAEENYQTTGLKAGV